MSVCAGGDLSLRYPHSAPFLIRPLLYGAVSANTDIASGTFVAEPAAEVIDGVRIADLTSHADSTANTSVAAATYRNSGTGGPAIVRAPSHIET